MKCKTYRHAGTHTPTSTPFNINTQTITWNSVFGWYVHGCGLRNKI